VNQEPIPYGDRTLRARRRHLERVAHAQIVAQLVAETGGDIEEEREKRRYAHTAVDALALRGIPAVGRHGAGGAIAGTQPGRNLFR
jgi:hypothetical protein